jgi:hypothetical protein
MDEYEAGTLNYFYMTSNEGSFGATISFRHAGNSPRQWKSDSGDEQVLRDIIAELEAEGWTLTSRDSRREDGPGMASETITIQLQRRLNSGDQP